MRPVILVGLIVTAAAAASGFALFLLVAVIVLSSSGGGNSSYPPEFGSYPSRRHEFPVSNDIYNGSHDYDLPETYPQIGGSPAAPYLNGNELDGRIYGSGTIDRSGEGNHVIGFDGRVLDLPN